MLEYVYGQAKQLLESIREETRETGLLSLVQPVAPFNRSALLLPLVVAGALISMIFLSGIAIGAFAALLAALVGLYLLLTEVFGVSLEVHAIPR